MSNISDYIFMAINTLLVKEINMCGKSSANDIV